MLHVKILFIFLFIAIHIFSCSKNTSSTSENNYAPTALFVFSPTSGTMETIFHFDAAKSSDSEDDFSDLLFSWDWENDGIWNIEKSKNFSPTHQFGSSNVFTVRLKVWDAHGKFNEFFRRVGVYETDSMTDIDGNEYKTVKIGNQWWMAEDLNVAHYRNGEAIPSISDKTQWASLTSGAYWPGWGAYYNSFAIKDTRDIAPEGWHVPSDEDWKILEMFLGMSSSEADKSGWRGIGIGNKLGMNGNNESGFSASTTGNISPDGSKNVGGNGEWWTSTEYDSMWTWMRKLDLSRSDIFRGPSGYKNMGMRVRCVKD